jgi:hypothetical protein
MAITARQRCHYSTMTEQESARIEAIRALVALSRFSEESDGAIRALRLLDASPAEMDSGARAQPVDSESRVPVSLCQA